MDKPEYPKKSRERKPKSLRVGKNFIFKFMKKLLVIACGILLISLSSCSTKCTCTTSATGTGSEYFPTSTTTMEGSGASYCKNASSTTTSGALTITTVCK